MPFPVILVKQPDKKPLYVQLHESIDVGRDCDGLVLADALVSRRHVSLELAGDGVILTDLDSTNGTFIDGVRVANAVRLEAGTEIRLGDTTIELVPHDDPRRTGMFRRDTTLIAQSGQLVPPDGAPAERHGDPVDDATRVEPSLDAGAATDPEDRGTLTIVFSDIVSSTERAAAIGDVAWVEELEAHNDIVRRNVAKWSGSIVKFQGDGFMLTFPGVRRGLSCMIDVQRDLRELSTRRTGFALRIRVGVHTGEVIVADGDIHGRHVVTAARIAGVAESDEILVSRLVREIVLSRGDLQFGAERIVALKGIGETEPVYPLIWE